MQNSEFGNLNKPRKSFEVDSSKVAPLCGEVVLVSTTQAKQKYPNPADD